MTKEIELPKNFSFTQFQLYSQCPHKYKVCYIDGIKEPPSEAMLFGNALHKLIENCYEAHDFVLTSWYSRWPVILNKYIPETRNSNPGLMQKGIKQISSLWGFLDREGLLVPCISTEGRLTGKYKGHGFTIVVDLVTKNNNDYHLIIDWKTGKEKEDHKYQIVLYAGFIRKKYNFDEMKGLICYPETGDYRYIPFSKELRETVSKYLSDIFNRLTTDKKFLPKKNIYCNNCFIKRAGNCPIFKF